MRWLGLLKGFGSFAAQSLIRDAVDLQHRHPRLWAALAEGKGRVWKARQVARLFHAAGLSRDQARFVDEATAPSMDTLTWSAFTRIVEARISEVDPDAADARALAAALHRFVATGRSTEHGLKTLIARAHAGEVIYFVAMCDRIAQLLQLDGDTDPVGIRRSKALAILANPLVALTLLEQHTSTQPPPTTPTRSPTRPSTFTPSPVPRMTRTTEMRWTRSRPRTIEMDHTHPYLPPDRGGPPGQTRPSNLGPMVTFGHRIKTHAHGWHHRQPQPGVYLWRTPHGHWYRTDDDGTHSLGEEHQLTD